MAQSSGPGNDTKDVLSFLDSLDTLTGSTGPSTLTTIGDTQGSGTKPSASGTDTADVLSFLDEITSLAGGGSGAQQSVAPTSPPKSAPPTATPPHPTISTPASPAASRPAPSAPTTPPTLSSSAPAPSAKGPTKHQTRPSISSANVPMFPPVEPVREDDAPSTGSSGSGIANLPPPPKSGFVPSAHPQNAPRDHVHHSKRIIMTAPEVLSPTSDHPSSTFPPVVVSGHPVVKVPEAKPELTTISASTPDLVQNSESQQANPIGSITSMAPSSWSSWSSSVLSTGAKWVATAKTQAERAAKEIVAQVQEEMSTNAPARGVGGGGAPSRVSATDATQHIASPTETSAGPSNLPSLLRSEWREVQHLGASILDQLQPLAQGAPVSGGEPTPTAPPPTPIMFLSFPSTVAPSLAQHLPSMADYVATEIIGKRVREAHRRTATSGAAAAATGTGKTIGLLLGLTTGAEDEDLDEDADKVGVVEWLQDAPTVNVVGISTEDGVWGAGNVVEGIDAAVKEVESALHALVKRYVPKSTNAASPTEPAMPQPSAIPLPNPEVAQPHHTLLASDSHRALLASLQTTLILVIQPFFVRLSHSSSKASHLSYLVALYGGKVGQGSQSVSAFEARSIAQTLPLRAVNGGDLQGERERTWMEEAELRSVEGAVVGVVEEWIGGCGGW
ncbi:hypothetical protein M427DRAFT_55138 [Gonapodya prolifera JEL478]|uniref:Uncharacterized protein n=1 Tax=Gonapodya prolifera (strain JEL478) TaxID=1344416 RepID=A0A139AJ82_GONPJ|nr:hypothetical protein M427DRAFT_55138 [Gonapodya prolifera JEL478]|eukprot:KXS16799.1 hypothetical protein M427DRAFT_55138 [Gonapodya prolifera JEL478]